MRGEYRQQQPSSRSVADHPRMRGEYPLYLLKPFLLEGSPPHARGIRVNLCKIQCRAGITPACAGNTCSRNHRADFQLGSPPHARGIRLSSQAHETRDHPRMRGEYPVSIFCGATVRDHPRMRGEYPTKSLCVLSCLGSPPHARGILRGVLDI